MMVSIGAAATTWAGGTVRDPVDVDVGRNWYPVFQVVGRSRSEERELRDRVRAALTTAGFEWPNRLITVSLPDRPHEAHAGCYDLAVAVGVLAASEQIPVEDLARYTFSAGLRADGSLRAVGGEDRLRGATQDTRLVVAADAQRRLAESGLSGTGGAVSLRHVVSCLSGEAELSGDVPDLQAAQPATSVGLS